MTTQAEFFQAHADEHGNLTEAQIAEMLNLPEGDTTKLFVESGKPDAASDKPGADDASAGDKDLKDGAAAADKPATTEGKTDQGTEGAGDKPATDEADDGKPKVILAKDGVHTIPYEKLTSARDAAKAAEKRAEEAAAEAERLRQELATAKSSTQPPAAGADKPANTETPTGDDVDFGDYSDEKIRAGVNALVKRQTAALVEQATAPLRAELETLKGKLGEAEAAKALTAQQEHFNAIYSAHKDADSIVESGEFAAWKAAQPGFARNAIEQTLKAGTAQDIVDVFTSYKQATGKTGAEPKPDAAAAAKKATEAAAAAQAAIDGATTKPPTSLSDIPAGSKAPHDEAAAMLEKSSAALMHQFEGLSPDEILKRMDKVL